METPPPVLAAIARPNDLIDRKVAVLCGRQPSAMVSSCPHAGAAGSTLVFLVGRVVECARRATNLSSRRLGVTVVENADSRRGICTSRRLATDVRDAIFGTGLTHRWTLMETVVSDVTRRHPGGRESTCHPAVRPTPTSRRRFDRALMTARSAPEDLVCCPANRRRHRHADIGIPLGIIDALAAARCIFARGDAELVARGCPTATRRLRTVLIVAGSRARPARPPVVIGRSARARVVTFATAASASRRRRDGADYMPRHRRRARRLESRPDRIL